MKLLVFLGILLPFTHAVKLTYSADGTGDISSLTFKWRNEDVSGIAEETGPNDATLITDGDTKTGEQLTNPSPGSSLWGIDTTTTPKGLTGTFQADSLTPGTGNQWWSITKATITFSSTQSACFSSSTSATLYYTAAQGGTKVTAQSVDVNVDGNEVTFTASLSGVATNGPIGFDIATNTYCAEAEISVMEFELIGTVVSTPAPTLRPTMSPTGSCSGSITWGDPHYYLMAMDGKDKRFDYQGYDWHYYLFPCDIDNDYEDFPFFYLTDHGAWTNPKATVMTMNMLVLNTKPNPWIIKFMYKESITNVNTLTIDVGSDRTHKVGDFSNLGTGYTRNNPLSIAYDDGQANPQKGELRIYYRKDMIHVELYDVQYNGYPRSCSVNNAAAFNKDCGDYKCEGQALEITNKGYFTVVECPTCLRNIACGLLGRYTRGDCDKNDIKDPTNPCYNILVGADGNLYTPPSDGNKVFIPFAETWKKDAVDAVLVQKGLTPISFQKTHKFQSDPRYAKPLDARTVVASDYLGECENNEARIREVNETCRVNTVVQYEKCCAEIGICNGLWDACTYDLCACTGDDGAGNVLDEDYCLEIIVHDSMNTSCSYEGFYPTDSPTGAPTSTPTQTPGPKVSKVQKLIWLYAIFVGLFVVIAIAAYCYYKKKNKGKAYFEADEDNEEAEMVEDNAAVKTTTET